MPKRINIAEVISTSDVFVKPVTGWMKVRACVKISTNAENEWYAIITVSTPWVHIVVHVTNTINWNPINTPAHFDQLCRGQVGTAFLFNMLSWTCSSIALRLVRAEHPSIEHDSRKRVRKSQGMVEYQQSQSELVLSKWQRLSDWSRSRGELSVLCRVPHTHSSSDHDLCQDTRNLSDKTQRNGGEERGKQRPLTSIRAFFERFQVDYRWPGLHIDSIVRDRLATSKYLFCQHSFTNHRCLSAERKLLSYTSPSNDQWLFTTTTGSLPGERVRRIADLSSSGEKYSACSIVFVQRSILTCPFTSRLIFYTSIVKSRAQHIVRLGMDGTNLKLLFTQKTSSDMDNINYLRPLLTFDRITHHLYFYNGLDKIFTLNMHGDVLHIQHQATHRFHAFRIFAGNPYLRSRWKRHWPF